ncbi:MAG: oligopeptide:H+ symporter [Proteobacteria bacterium]|nr:oligopeptide:H+ symporter [Pseudomonadota bacterium]MBW3618439.1 oligopeptide:H+ symporter [Pseudomonadota bacterium]
MNIVILLGILVTLVTGIPVLLQMVKTHPKGLMILFFAEMWERFSFYGMRGLLIFFLTQHFLFDDEFASSQYGSYGSLVYLLPLVGGIVADRYIGTRKAIVFGALLLVAGHGLMAYEGRPATQSLTFAGQTYDVRIEGRAEGRTTRLIVGGQPYEYSAEEGGGLAIAGLPAGSPIPSVLPGGSYQMAEDRDDGAVRVFYLALALIIMGVGFLKPNISTIVGQLYPKGDPRRDSGFTLYYYGINLGAFWASVLCGYLGQRYGWNWGFGLAGIGMFLGLVVFVLGKPLLQGKGEAPDPVRLKQPVVGPLNREWLVYLFGLLGVLVVYFVVPNHDLVGTGLIVSTVLALGFIGYMILFKLKDDKVARERMMLATVLIFGSVIFFTLFEQAGSSLNLFADRNVDLSVTSAATSFGPFLLASPAQLAAAGGAGGRIWIDTGITAAQTQSFNAGFILIFAPIFAAMWAGLARNGRDPNPVMKFGLALIQVGLGFLVVVWGVNAGLVNEAFRTPLVMLLFLYLLHTTGELFLSPVGLSEITKLSVASIVSFMMAVWFMASSIAHFVGGQIAAAAGTETVGGQVLDPGAALNSSIESFNMLGWWGVGLGVAFIASSFFIKQWAHGVNNPESEGEKPVPTGFAPTVDGERQVTSPAAIRGERPDPAL